MSRKSSPSTYELSRVIDINHVKEQKSVTLDIDAGAEEREALAKRFQILEISDLKANIVVRAHGGDIFRLKGTLRAHVSQACGVTLAPVPETVDEAFEETLTTDPKNLGLEEEPDQDAEKPVDLIVDDKIDAGEIVAQWLALSLNPFPRSDAPPFEYMEDADSAEGKQTHSPFSFLENLKKK